MKLKVTVNLGNYENMSAESSEYKHVEDCKAEIYIALRQFNKPLIDDFCKRMFEDTQR